MAILHPPGFPTPWAKLGRTRRVSRSELVIHPGFQGPMRMRTGTSSRLKLITSYLRDAMGPRRLHANQNPQALAGKDHSPGPRITGLHQKSRRDVDATRNGRGWALRLRMRRQGRGARSLAPAARPRRISEAESIFWWISRVEMYRRRRPGCRRVPGWSLAMQ